MKGKFKLLGHIGLALFLVSALMLAFMPAAPVQAATAVTNVWVQFEESPYNINHATTAVAAGFTIHFTPTTAMKRGVDTITVWFPDGSTAMGPAAFSLASSNTTATNYKVDRDGEALTYSATACTLAAVRSTSGYRITVTTPVDLDAGSACSLQIMKAANVKTSESTSHNQYTIKVYTSKDTTPVASDAFDLDASADGIDSVELSFSPTTAGLAGQYTFTVATENATQLTAAAEDTLTFIFPLGTTMPSSIAADKVSLSNDTGSSWSTSTVDPVVNQKARMVTVRTPITLTAHATKNQVRFSTGAGILNPTTRKNSDYTDCYCFTSQDELMVAEDGYNVTAGTAVKLGFNNDPYPGSAYSDSATMINMKSDVLYVQLQDEYGNVKHPDDPEPTVSFSSSSGGVFFSPQDSQTSTKQLEDGKASVYYRDSAAGTVTLTASHDDYTDATWTMTITPGVKLYDSNNNLMKTYAPTAASPVTESATVHSGDYIQNAITAAVTGDTVKLGDGIYELDSYISLSAKITLTSENGASSTTLRPYAESNWYIASDVAIVMAVTGTAANPVIIDGLTFTRLRKDTEFDQAIFINGDDYVTVRNCVFDYIIPEYHEDSEWGSVVSFIVAENLDANAASITSATVSNNTFTNCCAFYLALGDSAVINLMTKSSADDKSITGATVSGNTLTDCNGINISIEGYNSTNSSYVTANVTDNTITNGKLPMYIGQQTVSVKVLRNTITGGYNYGIRVGSFNSADHDYLVIKNNTITGCAGAQSATESYAIWLQQDGTPTTAGTGVDTGANTVQYNDVSNNDAEYSIYATSGIGAQSCQYNYFGDATGPYYSALTGATVAKSNTGGAGKKVADLVTYYPWLHKSKADVVTDNASYQACTMKLIVGWNTLSTPVKLIAAADAIDELISADAMSIGYYYDEGWQQIIDTYTLSPCDAVYVKMSAAADVLLKFDASAFSTASKDLKVGWNLISLAYLSSSGMQAVYGVASVYKTAANLPGYSQVISPSLNNDTQRDLYYSSSVTDWTWTYSSGQAAGDSHTMRAGLGYWIYMQNAATLAGFEITPIVPDLD